MAGNVIEKTYRYTIPKPDELFQAFREKFSGATLPDSWEVSDPWTITVLGIFDQIGRGFGYMPRKEYLRLDQTWEIRLPELSTIILALEHDNTDSPDEVLNDELQKLVDVKALLKVLIFYPNIPAIMGESEFVYPEFQQRIRSGKIKTSDERYLVITPVYIKQQSMIEVSACTFDSEGKGEELGSFQVKYTSKE